MKYIFGLITLLFLGIACNNNDNVITEYQLSVPFEVKVGETAFCNCEAPVITFETVISEARCPPNSFCFAGGYANIRLGVGADTLIILAGQYPDDNQEVILNGFGFTVVDLYPDTDALIEMNDYRLELTVRKL